LIPDYESTSRSTCGSESDFDSDSDEWHSETGC